MYGLQEWWRRKIRTLKIKNIEFQKEKGSNEKVLTCRLELTDKFFTRKTRSLIDMNNLRIYNKAGLPLTQREGELYNQDVLEGAMLSAFNSMVSEIFEDKISHIETSYKILIIAKTRHLMGCLELENNIEHDIEGLGLGLRRLLKYIEKQALRTGNDDLEDCSTAEKLFSDSLKRIPSGIMIEFFPYLIKN